MGDPTTNSTKVSSKLADANYPSEFEWASLVSRQQDDYDRKMVVNLMEMLEEARRYPPNTKAPQQGDS